MKDLKLQIVSFDVPYPPNYGGVIDVFYKLKNLAALGLKIYLHTFEYGRGEQKELEKYCEKVFYYPRNNKFKSFSNTFPFIVQSRANKRLVERLKSVNTPILFEGLHTTYPLIKNNFKQKVFIRTHNIEHEYYLGLYKSETKTFKRWFFRTEANKLKNYEAILEKADKIFTISPLEQSYFQKKYGSKACYLPVFFDFQFGEYTSEREDFILWHGDLRVSDNVKSALFAMNSIKGSNYKLVIASSFKDASIMEQIRLVKNITFHSIPSQEDLNDLLSRAKVNMLFTFQQTGIKLKLMNALCKGGFILTNPTMVVDTGLENFCSVVNNQSECLKTLDRLFSKAFSEIEYQKRVEGLQVFNGDENAKKLKSIIFS